MSCTPIKKKEEKKPCENSELVITVKKKCIEEPESASTVPAPKPGPVVKTINGIKYFKLQSNYPGDYTKNCGLLGNEIDENFYFLRSNDIKCGYTEEVDNKKYLVLVKVDDEEIRIDITEADIPYKFNFSDGYITITFPDGHEERLGKFLVEGDNVTVATDATIMGDGSCEKPLSIDLAYRTGTYEPADFYADLTCSSITIDDLPTPGYGHAIITKERASRFGRLYNYWEADRINKALGDPENKCGWRLPNNEDWAKLLNWAEYCEIEECKNHDDPTLTWHGCVAGARLKSIDYWREKDGFGPGDDLDFSIYPVGYCPDPSSAKETAKEDFMGLYDSTAFWTSTSANGMYLARLFSFAHNDVQLVAKAPNEMLSIRLVKDITNDDLDIPGYDYILGHYVPVVPGADGKQLWTKFNIDFTVNGYNPNGVYVPEAWSGVAGEDLISEAKFYYNVWDGKRWHKHVLTEGESVVILGEDLETECSYGEDPYVTSANTNHEWRIYTDPETGEDELVDTLEALKGEFNREFEEIYDVISGLSEDLVTLSGFVESAYDEMQSGFTSAFTAINDLQGELDTVEASVGLEEDGTFIAPESGYTASAKTIKEAIEILDQVILENEEVTSAALNDLNDRIISVETEITEIVSDQEEISEKVDNIITATGLNEDGTHKPSDGNYTSEAETIEDEISALDEALKETADDVAELKERSIERLDESIVVEKNGNTTYVGVNIPNNGHIGVDEYGLFFDGDFGEYEDVTG